MCATRVHFCKIDEKCLSRAEYFIKIYRFVLLTNGNFRYKIILLFFNKFYCFKEEYIMLKNEYLKRVYADVEKRNANEPEFL